ncbi:hypothetical protein F2P81_009308 [Scophthalmus maximus]|uniref:SRCR domain-containing protein n=1 Tax=Scophthalmus maximus TaxID=52904 RepID=A0A6A4T6N6_SCOMX|nr:hypothetical protein F2P81_009308 [Scophthalmus maximus]
MLSSSALVRYRCLARGPADVSEVRWRANVCASNLSDPYCLFPAVGDRIPLSSNTGLFLCGKPSCPWPTELLRAHTPLSPFSNTTLAESTFSERLGPGDSDSVAESVRLVNGTNRCSGRLEVKSDESWSSVCGVDFDQQVAEVVCRELDCGVPSVLQGALNGQVEAPVWSRGFQCEGSESHLLDCEWSDSATKSVRLVNGTNRCSGRLEVKSNES